MKAYFVADFYYKKGEIRPLTGLTPSFRMPDSVIQQKSSIKCNHKKLRKIILACRSYICDAASLFPRLTVDSAWATLSGWHN